MMRQIDEMYLKDPTKGSRGMKRQLKREGQRVNRKRIQRLMRLMGIEAIYPKPHTSRPHPQHRIYPYLLRDLTIDRPNQVWAADITYVPMMSMCSVSIAENQRALVKSLCAWSSRS